MKAYVSSTFAVNLKLFKEMKSTFKKNVIIRVYTMYETVCHP